MISALFVTYRPNIELLSKSISSIIEQVDSVVVISNSSMREDSWILSSFPSVDLICLEGNKGIAHAQNVGVKRISECGGDYVIFSDQDTVYPPQYVYSLMATFEVMSADLVAAVVPAFYDEVKDRLEQYIPDGSILYRRKDVKGGVVAVQQAIASGMIVKLDALENVGLMDDRLFIDWVDIEWCWRARALGYKIFMNSDVIINHQLGDNAKNIIYRKVNLRSPIRHYYITRNAFHLAFRSDVLSGTQKFILMIRSLRYLVAFPLLSEPRLENIRMVTCALRDAAQGRLGPFGGKSS